MRLPLILSAALVLSACATGDGPFSNPDDTVDLNSAVGSGVGTDPLTDGGINDPSSVAFFQQTVGDRILFEVDQSTLNAQARAILDNQADFLLRNMEFTALIEGHADEQGTREYNLALGARRAASVQEYLTSRGISADRLRTVSYGKERPIEICSEESCYALNRRSVTVLGAGPGA